VENKKKTLKYLQIITELLYSNINFSKSVGVQGLKEHTTKYKLPNDSLLETEHNHLNNRSVLPNDNWYDINTKAVQMMPVS